MTVSDFRSEPSHMITILRNPQNFGDRCLLTQGTHDVILFDGLKKTML